MNTLLHKLKSWSQSCYQRCDFSRAKARVAWACLISLTLHFGFAIWGALWSWESRAGARDVALSSTWAPAETADFVVPAELSTLQPAAESHDVGGFGERWINPLTVEANVAVPEIAANAQPSQASELPKSDDAAGGQSGQGTGRGRGNGNGSGYFAVSRQAKSFVFVLDCSMSMNHRNAGESRTRFGQMKKELARSLGQLTSEQQFFIVFFNHEALPMPAHGLVPAGGKNPQRYLAWVEEIKPTGDTDPIPALQIALQLQPEVIFLLTDGCFSPAANDILRKTHLPKTVIHTIAFEPTLTSKQRDGFELLRQGKSEKARLKLGEATFRRTHELFVAEEVMQKLASQNRGEFRVVQ